MSPTSSSPSTLSARHSDNSTTVRAREQRYTLLYLTNVAISCYKSTAASQHTTSPKRAKAWGLSCNMVLLAYARSYFVERPVPRFTTAFRPISDSSAVNARARLNPVCCSISPRDIIRPTDKALRTWASSSGPSKASITGNVTVTMPPRTSNTGRLKESRYARLIRAIPVPNFSM